MPRTTLPGPSVPSCWNSYLHLLSRSGSEVEAAVADNCRFDERCSDERWQRFGTCLGPTAEASLSHADWSEAAKLSYEAHVTVPSTSVPDAFLEINRGAWLSDLPEEPELVRLEGLEWPLSSLWEISLQELEHLKKPGQPADSDAPQTLASLFDDWNRQRDNRPAFAAFLDEVGDEAHHADWSHCLRDRLGLAHYSGSPGNPLPVALMKYSLRDVLQARARRNVATGCSLPTVEELFPESRSAIRVVRWFAQPGSIALEDVDFRRWLHAPAAQPMKKFAANCMDELTQGALDERESARARSDAVFSLLYAQADASLAI
jgi:hypothetical protein